MDLPLTVGAVQQTERDAIADTFNRLAIHVLRLSSQSELSLSAASTLARLQRSGALRLTDLAERERITQPSMTALVNRLESQGMVRRNADPTDGRAVLVEVTDAGRVALARRAEARVGTMAADLADLDEADLRTLIAALPAIDRLITTHPAER
jgi:DNA-binding MarR family transcriptional regulator